MNDSRVAYSRSPPTSSGWYWYRTPQRDCAIAYVVIGEGICMYCTWMTQGGLHKLSHADSLPPGEWVGPLFPPEEDS